MRSFFSCKHLHLRGVELTRYALCYCFCFSEGKTSSTDIPGICLVFITSPALLQKNKEASDWVQTFFPLKVDARKAYRCVHFFLTNIFISVRLS